MALGILLGALLELKPIFIQASIDNHTTLLLSGILTEQVPELIEAYSPHFKVVAIDTKEDWAMVHCQRTA
jgi:ribosomal protein L11 methylase PrmA